MLGSPFALSKVWGFCVHEFDPLFSDKCCVVEAHLDVNFGRDYSQAEGLNLIDINIENQALIG